MTAKEIYENFDIPISTLNDWQKSESRKHKLYSFLIKADIQDIDKIINSGKSNRVFQILNKNIEKQNQYQYEEIQRAFLKKEYSQATQREQVLYAKFFKEFDQEDLEELCRYFEVNKRDIKKLYVSSPYRELKGVAKVWDRRFRLKHTKSDKKSITTPPLALQQILSKRG